MKTLIAIILALSVMLFSLPLLAESTLSAATEVLKETATLDEQLALLNDISNTYSSELENGGWDVSLNLPLSDELPGYLCPPIDFDDAISGELPEELLDLKYIALYDDNGTQYLLGDYLARLPIANRAASLSEVQAVLFLRHYLVRNTRYTGYAYNRIYATYVWRIGSDEIYEISSLLSSPAAAGIGTLYGSTQSLYSLWWSAGGVRRAFFGDTLSVTDKNGSIMIFSINGAQSCRLDSVILAEGANTLDVPQTVGNWNVTEISSRCMDSNNSIVYVSLPDGLTYIGDYAFAHCKNLTRVDLPDTLEALGGYAFFGCSKLKSIELPASVCSVFKEAIRNCDELESITLPASAVLYDDNIFLNTTRLARVIVNGDGEYIGTILSQTNPVGCFLPAHLNGIDGVSSSFAFTRFYAPENSDSFRWLTEHGFECTSCNQSEDMPLTEYIIEGDFEFLIFDGEASLYRYIGKADNLIIPSEAAGCPVTRVMRGALKGYYTHIIVPESVRYISKNAVVYVPEEKHLYITNPDTKLFGDTNKTIIHAPEGSTAQKFAEKNGNPFEPWDCATLPF